VTTKTPSSRQKSRGRGAPAGTSSYQFTNPGADLGYRRNEVLEIGGLRKQNFV
jgi:hypothetical protein